MEPSDYIPLPSEAHAFINGVLTVEKEHEFQRRMAADPDLKQRVAELQAARKLLGSLAPVSPPADFDDKVRARIRRVEMARSALESLRQAPMPWWKRAAMVGGGAIAAALVFAVVGAPGVFNRGAEPVGDGPMARMDGMMPELTEADILPVLCDQYHRYREVSRQVSFARGLDADGQREMLRAELATSDLTARAQRLSTLCNSLPVEQRRDYLRFLASLAEACDRIDGELVASRNEKRAPNLGMIGDTFSEVSVPERLSSQSGLHVARSGAVSGLRQPATPVSSGANPELEHYSRAREAYYARDYVLAGQLFDSYLAAYSGGRFRDSALTSSLSAHVRAGNMRRAEALQRDIKVKDAALLKQVDAADLSALGRAIADRTLNPDG